MREWRESHNELNYFSRYLLCRRLKLLQVGLQDPGLQDPQQLHHPDRLHLRVPLQVQGEVPQEVGQERGECGVAGSGVHPVQLCGVSCPLVRHPDRLHRERGDR